VASPDSRTEIGMLKPPDDGTRLGALELRATRLRAGLTGRHGQRAGLRNVAFEVNDSAPDGCTPLLYLDLARLVYSVLVPNFDERVETHC
jgi:hypothetical protein